MGEKRFYCSYENEKIGKELLAETRSQQDVYENANCREKRTERSRTLKTNKFGSSTPTPKKQKFKGCIQPRRRGRQYNYRAIQRRRDQRGRQNIQRWNLNKRGQ